MVGVTPGVIGSLEALETLKYLFGQEETCLKNRLLIWEGDIGAFEKISVEKNPSCPVCGN